MADTIKIKKGLDIPLKGAPSAKCTTDSQTTLFGIVPDDFPGHKWKCAVKIGDKVRTGTPIMYSKDNDAIKLVSPVCGTIEDIRRGERRKVEAIAIRSNTPGGTSEPDDCIIYSEAADMGKNPYENAPEQILDILCQSGLFALFRQRPFDIVPDTNVMPRDIFVTSFDTAPLAPALIDNNDRELHEKGLEILKRLTKGNLFLCVHYDSHISSRIAKTYEFSGPHPAGNLSVQIEKIRPVNRGETVWALDSSVVVRIGELFTTGRIDTKANVAVCGDMATDPHIIRTHIGASLHSLLQNQIKNEQDVTVSIISGNVLTGIRTDLDTGFLHYPYRQITLIADGSNADEFMGWATLRPDHYSVKRTFPAFLLGKRGNYSFDSRLRGGRRAMILSGEMDKVFPMDIYPEFLLKAIMSGDIEKMEQLGIYEIAPEDFALAEFVDTSKQPLQKIVREGLEKLRNNLA